MAIRTPRSKRSGSGAPGSRARLVTGVVLAVALVGGFAAQAGRGVQMPGFASSENRALRDAVSVEAPDLGGVYEARRYQPIWVEGEKIRPEARELIALIASAPEDGLNPEQLGLSRLRQALVFAETGSPSSLARFEVEASRALAEYVVALRRPTVGGEMIYTDPAAAPAALTRPAVVQAASEAPSLRAHLAGVRKMHPVYEGLRRDLALHRKANPGKADDARTQLILINLDRARALPTDPRQRHVVVDTAAAMLWLYEGGRAVDSMKVIVGKEYEPTPFMAGVIRYALFNPYWNVPEDLVRDQWAPRVLREGPGVIAERGMEVLSDWSPNAQVVDPAGIDWQAVASGQQYLRVRQKPGPSNMMGNVKFMLPNDLGIYLHDTPNKAAFASGDRWFSAGCVRVEDAPRLARWLLGELPATPSTADYRVDLRQPVPVYMTYLTVAPGQSGATFRRDVYGRDGVSVASLRHRDKEKAA